MRRILTLSIWGLIAACSSLVYYQDPSPLTNNFARIEIRNLSEGSSDFFTILYQDPIVCTGQVVMKRENGRMPTPLVLHAEKGKAFTIASWYVMTMYPKRYKCYLGETFVPVDDSYVFDYSGNAFECSLRANKVVGKKVVPLTGGQLVRRKFNLPFLQSGAFCKPLQQDELDSLSKAT